MKNSARLMMNLMVRIVMNGEHFYSYREIQFLPIS